MGADCSCCGKAENDQFICNPKGCWEGEAHCFCNTICCPVVCPAQSCWIYCAPCFEVWCNRCCYCAISPCKCCCPTCCCYQYTDDTFTGKSALGNDFNSDKAGNVIFERAQRLYSEKAGKGQAEACCGPTPGQMRLFNVNTDKDAMDGPAAKRIVVEAGDIKQGALGDCWLLGAIAAYTEVPGGIQNIFVNRERSPRGKYVVNLYCANEKKFVEIEIDDTIPIYDKSLEEGYVPQAAFAQPNGNELWAILLEKAFAKFCGSYENLSGGQTVWGLQALTGSEICLRFLWEPKEKHWARLDIEAAGTKEKPRAVKMTYHQNKGKKEVLGSDRLFKTLRKYNQNTALIAASISGTGSEEKLPLGLIGGHAYTVLRVEFVDPAGGGFLGLGGAEKSDYFKMVQLRNPWGKGEWEGDWSDKSTKWGEFPKVAKTLNDDDNNTKSGGDHDGIFWMQWEDFIKHYNNIEVCDRKQSLRDLTLEVHEEDGPCGVCCGCVGGCIDYHCCCTGCHKLYCVRKPTAVTIGEEDANSTKV